MSKLEWYWIALLNMAANEYAYHIEATDAFWRWHNSKQYDQWIGHVDGPNRHPGGWEGWMAEFP